MILNSLVYLLNHTYTWFCYGADYVDTTTCVSIDIRILFAFEQWSFYEKDKSSERNYD
jgi:hypothetical protein